MENFDEWITTRQAAELTGVSQSRVKDAVTRKRFSPADVKKEAGRTFLRKDAVLTWRKDTLSGEIRRKGQLKRFAKI